MQVRDEGVSLAIGTDGHDFEEKRSEVFRIGPFGVAPTPHQALSLDVHQTALNQDSRPQQAHDPDEMAITVERHAVRKEAMLFEITAKGIQMGGAFGDLRGPVYDRIVLRVHGRKNPLAPVEKRSIQQQISVCGEVDLPGGRMRKPILEDPSNGTGAVTALSGALFHGVALNNPAVKPNTFPEILVDSAFPDKGATTLSTPPALFVLPAFAVALNTN